MTESTPDQNGPSPRRVLISTTRADGNASPFAFTVVVIIALPLLLYWGRRWSFSVDDWDFIANRTAGNLHDLTAAHYDHWTTLPILAYRGIWSVFGLHHYVPYQLLVISAHLATSVLLFVIMRRAGVDTWIATIAGTAFVFLGSGAIDMLSAFQVTFTAALLLGLVQLVLADHDGPLSGRDWLGLVAGLAALMCSGVAVAMVVVVGITMLLRRSWRDAMFHSAPLAVIYIIWYASIGYRTRADTGFEKATAADIGRFAVKGLWSALSDLGQVPGVGLALAGMLLVALICLLQARDPTMLIRGKGAAPVAMLLGAVVFLLIVGQGRAGKMVVPVWLQGDGGRATSDNSRYVYIVAAMLLPSIALAANTVVHRWRRLTLLVAALLVVGIPGNLEQMARAPGGIAAQRTQELITDANLPIADKLPRSLKPEPFLAGPVTMGWLIDNVRAGRIPRAHDSSPERVAAETLRLAVRGALVPANGPCLSVRSPADYRLPFGFTFTLANGSANVSLVLSKRSRSTPVALATHTTKTVLAGPLLLHIAPATGSVVDVCQPSRA